MRGLALILGLLAAWPAQGACRLALALGLDVSGSVDDTEYAVQMSGLAGALMSDQVRAALLATPDAPVKILVFAWAGQWDQALILPWTPIDDARTLTEIAETLRHVPRPAMAPATAIGQAMRYGERVLARQPDCWRHTLDLSGDGRNNSGPRPRAVAVTGITINGLVIGKDPRNASQAQLAETGELRAYYIAEVIRGPDAFTETAAGFADFQAAMTRKLLKELTHLILSHDTGD